MADCLKCKLDDTKTGNKNNAGLQAIAMKQVETQHHLKACIYVMFEFHNFIGQNLWL